MKNLGLLRLALGGLIALNAGAAFGIQPSLKTQDPFNNDSAVLPAYAAASTRKTPRAATKWDRR